MSFYDAKHENNRSISYTKFWDCRWGSKWSLVSSALYVYGGTTITFDIGQPRQICVYQWGIRMTMMFYDEKHKNKRSISYKKFPDCRSVSKWSSVSTALHYDHTHWLYDSEVRSKCADEIFERQCYFYMENPKIKGQSLIWSFESVTLCHSGHSYGSQCVCKGAMARPSLLTYDSIVRSACTSKGFEWQWVFTIVNIKIRGQSLIRRFGATVVCQSSHSWVWVWVKIKKMLR